MARVLIVEDDVVTSAILARAIEQAGHEVAVAPNGLAAYELLAEDSADVLISDVRMPRLDGRELCERVRAEACHRDMPILLTTGVVDPDELAWTEEMPGVEILPKPIQIAELVARIGKLTGD